MQPSSQGHAGISAVQTVHGSDGDIVGAEVDGEEDGTEFVGEMETKDVVGKTVGLDEVGGSAVPPLMMVRVVP